MTEETPDREGVPMGAGAQGRWDIRCEWGPRGLAALGPLSDVVVIVDVLSFSTCVEIAVSRGGVVFPFAWRDARALEFARDKGAELAGPRGETALSLSPASFLRLAPGTRVVLPSPNGAALSAGANRGYVLAGCLRNAAAVAQAARALGQRVLVLPAGEQWPDGSLRPCVEDWLGAGAIVDRLSGTCAPEAETARLAFRAAGADLARLLHGSTSGRELIDRGYAEDVTLATALNVSEAVPVLRDGAYHRLAGGS
jgi:2-phosphosulfolactate phosphatase